MSAIFVISALSIGCSGIDELSRSRAEALISASPQFTEDIAELWFYHGGRDAWEAQGGANNPKVVGQFSNLTQSGLRLVAPTKRKIIEITGIAESVALVEGVKEVQFTWAYSALSELAKRYLATGGTGTAYFRLYDDGWRLEGSPELTADRTAPTFSASEQAEIEEDIQAERERVAQAEAERQQRMEFLGRAIEDSKQPTETLLVAETYMHSPISSAGGRATLTLTDVNVTYSNWVGGNEIVLWFGHIERFGAVAGGGGWKPSIQGTNHGIGTFELYFPTDEEQQKVLKALSAANEAWWNKYAGAWGDAARLGLLGPYIKGR